MKVANCMSFSPLRCCCGNAAFNVVFSFVVQKLHMQQLSRGALGKATECDCLKSHYNYGFQASHFAIAKGFFGRRHAVVEFIVSATAAAHAVEGAENCTERLNSLDFRQNVLYSERSF